MCKNMFKVPSIPAPPPPVPPPAPAETIAAPEPEPIKDANERTQRALDTTRKRAAALASLSNTTLTSPLGISGAAATTSKSLLGQ